MGEPYVGEIRMFGGNFPPNGWMFCEGASLPISENEVLFQLIGTTYGGDGQETFNLPNLASRVPIRRAGSTNTGSSTSASRVICQEIPIITARVSASVRRLPATSDRVSLKARCAPMTSLFNRLTSAPVRVRVKNAIGIRWT